MTLPEQRCALMREEGIEQVLILPFNAEVARLTAQEQFVEQVLVRKLGAGGGGRREFPVRQQEGRRYAAARSLGQGAWFHTRRSVPAVSCRGGLCRAAGCEPSCGIGRGGERRAAADAAVCACRRGGFRARRGREEDRADVESGHAIRECCRSAACTSRALQTSAADAAGVGHQHRSPAYFSAATDSLSIETFLLDPLAGPGPSAFASSFCGGCAMSRNLRARTLSKDKS